MKVVYAATRNLYPCMGPTIKSLFAHNDPERVYIMAEDDDIGIPLPDVCQVVNVSGQKWITNKTGRFTWMASLRCCYPEIFPGEDKLLQLDIDTIVCDSLQPLWETDLTGKWFGAVREWLGHYHPYGTSQYYNIGVALFNLAQMRKDNILPKLLDIVNNQRMLCQEQDALNCYAVPMGKVVDIPVRYNVSFCCGDAADPAIVHYAGVGDWFTSRTMKHREYLDGWR